MTRRTNEKQITPDAYQARAPTWPAACKDWVRFDEYEIFNGNIRPVPEAQLIPYDPWDDYVNQTHGRVPHVELAEVVKINTKAAILAFVCRYGLFGFWLHSTDFVNYPPIWLPDGKICVANQPTMARFGGKWIEGLRAIRPRRTAPLASAWTLVDPELQGTIRENILCLGVVARERPLERSLRTFMPSWKGYAVKDVLPPPPKSDAFWRCYEEPLSIWQMVAKNLNHVFASTVGNLKLKSAPLGYLPEHAAFHRRFQYGDFFFAGAMSILESLASEATTSLHFNSNGAGARRPSHPSLIGYMADMHIEDLLENRDQFFVCEWKNCRKRTPLGSKQDKYCSDRCYVNAKKHRSRAKKKQQAERF